MDFSRLQSAFESSGLWNPVQFFTGLFRVHWSSSQSRGLVSPVDPNLSTGLTKAPMKGGRAMGWGGIFQ